MDLATASKLTFPCLLMCVEPTTKSKWLKKGQSYKAISYDEIQGQFEVVGTADCNPTNPSGSAMWNIDRFEVEGNLRPGHKSGHKLIPFTEFEARAVLANDEVYCAKEIHPFAYGLKYRVQATSLSNGVTHFWMAGRSDWVSVDHFAPVSHRMEEIRAASAELTKFYENDPTAGAF